MFWMVAETGVEQRRQEIPWSVDLCLSTLGLSMEIETVRIVCIYNVTHADVKMIGRTFKGQGSVSSSLLVVFLYPGWCKYSLQGDKLLSLCRFIFAETVRCAYSGRFSFPSVLQEFLRIWHHTQLFAFSGAIRATAHVPKQVRACTDSQRVQECAAQRLAGSCSIQLFVEVAVTLQTFLSRPVVYNDSKSVTMSTAQAESKCSLSVSNGNLVTKTELF